MPTRRQLLSGSAATVAGVGATAVLASCAPPPPTTPAKRYATLYRNVNGYTRDLVTWDGQGHGSKHILTNVFGRPAWFADGSSICISRGVRDDSEGTWQLWILRSDGSLLRSITNPALGVADLDPCVSPDGKTIAFTRDTIGFGAGSGLWTVQTDGTGLRAIPGGFGGIAPSFSHDGKFIVYAAFDGIRRLPIAGGTPLRIAAAASHWQLSQPNWSRANNHVAFIRRDSEAADSLCYVPGAGGAKITVMFSSDTGIECPTWASDSATVHYARFNGYGAEGRVSTDVYKQAIGGLPIRVFRPSGTPATDLATLP
jgi:Tol biopolymer transport system component